VRGVGLKGQITELINDQELWFGEVRACPPEKLAAQVGARAPKMGRPPVTGRAMTGRERIARYRAKNKSARRPTSVLGPTPSALPLRRRRAAL
jgi:hypothetical protein